MRRLFLLIWECRALSRGSWAGPSRRVVRFVLRIVSAGLSVQTYWPESLLQASLKATSLWRWWIWAPTARLRSATDTESFAHPRLRGLRLRPSPFGWECARLLALSP